MQPVFSPDGEKLAFLGGRRTTFKYDEASVSLFLTDLFVARADGTEARQLTSTARQLELYPSWDPSGNRLAYTEMAAEPSVIGHFGRGDSIIQMNPDGSCRTAVISSRRFAYFGAAWRPGIGREAGPISC